MTIKACSHSLQCNVSNVCKSPYGYVHDSPCPRSEFVTSQLLCAYKMSTVKAVSAFITITYNLIAYRYESAWNNKQQPTLTLTYLFNPGICHFGPFYWQLHKAHTLVTRLLREQLWVFVSPQGWHAALMGVKFDMEESTKGCCKGKGVDLYSD